MTTETIQAGKMGFGTYTTPPTARHYKPSILLTLRFPKRNIKFCHYAKVGDYTLSGHNQSLGPQ